ncbi:MAG TPA: V-type ATPase subunit [Syntrophorhabdaceae bacterium]|nr:V-type ATPase subunit [Syntrophorhabdaceae bacterium]
MIPRIKNRSNWGFVSGRISVLESGFLPKEFFLNMINTEKVDNVIALLQETFVKDYITPGAMWLGEDLGTIFDRCFNDMAFSIRGDCPVSLPVDIFLIKNDYLNLKAAMTGKKSFVFPPCLFSIDMLSSIADGDYSDLPPSFKESPEWSGTEIFDISPGNLDIMLDGAYLRHLLFFSRQTESELIKKYIHYRVISHLIIILWRALNQGISLKRYQQYLPPLGDFTHLIDELAGIGGIENWRSIIGGEVGELLFECCEYEEIDNISVFDYRVMNYLSRLAHDGAYQTAGPERVLAFILGFSIEIQNLKLIVTGRINRVDPNFLKNRLKDCYV